MGVILAATDALEWLSRLTGQSAAQLTGALDALQAPSKTLFLPYLGGERTPHNDANMRGQFLHLDHATDAQAAARAVLEGVSYAFADCQQALAATGTTAIATSRRFWRGFGGGTPWRDGRNRCRHRDRDHAPNRCHHRSNTYIARRLR